MLLSSLPFFLLSFQEFREEEEEERRQRQKLQYGNPVEKLGLSVDFNEVFVDSFSKKINNLG